MKKSRSKTTKKVKSIKSNKKSNNWFHLIVGILAIIIIVAIAKYAGQGDEPTITVQPEVIPEPEMVVVPIKHIDYETQGVEGKYDYTKEVYEGNNVLSGTHADLVSNIRCNYMDNTVAFTLTNLYDQSLKLYLEESPIPPNQVLINVNGRRLFFMDCGGKTDLEPGYSVECTQTGNMFLRLRKDTMGDQDLNTMQIKLFGGSDNLRFNCE